MRQPKPWFRSEKNAWYVQVGRRQVSLGRDEAEAMRRYHRLMADEGLLGDLTRPGSEVQVALVCDMYLEHSSRHHAPATYELNKLRLQDLCDRHGTLAASALKPFHVDRWLEAHAWGPSTRREAIAILKAAINRAVEQGYLRDNPIRSLRRPPMGRRETILTAEQRRAILEAVPDPEFHDFLVALQGTGARPGEVAAVTAADLDLEGGTWVLQKHKTRAKTGRARIVYLTGPLVELCRRLAALRPAGPLFRNTDGNAWTRNAIRCRFRRLRQRLGLDAGVVAYTYRHTWATDALEGSVPIATVAELLGHADTKMVSSHYGHLSEKREHLRTAARSVRPGES